MRMRLYMVRFRRLVWARTPEEAMSLVDPFELERATMSVAQVNLRIPRAPGLASLLRVWPANPNLVVLSPRGTRKQMRAAKVAAGGKKKAKA